ncbi:hypothetical protein [Sphingomonas rubra]|uniref:Uncharacterized protein n=1 Tax=Sphingomonas rubra TaxID=634430 RepID=A0A1I5SPU4_9SPHN|nr:hypothetical protein [Sphingomonas rubra]SFP72822.1 hypothetical protein SAMN04488241_10653 [Sphingomonas rubra]
MPTEQPNNQPTDTAPQPLDGESAAAVLSDGRMDDAPGGGGLMVAGAGGADAGTAMGKAGAATPNSPIDAELPHGGGEELAEKEAQTRALGDEPSNE